MHEIFRRSLVALAMSLVLFAACAHAQSIDGSALATLDAITKRYASATSYRIESVAESTNRRELATSISRELLSSEAAPGNRYRYEGRNAFGSGLIVSNGVDEWEFHRSFGDVTRKAAGAFGHPFPSTPTDGDFRAVSSAYGLIRSIALIGNSAKAAHFLPEQTIDVAGRKIPCLVIDIAPADLRKLSPSGTVDATYWIDKSRRLIVKSVVIEEIQGPFSATGRVHLNPILEHVEITTTYPQVHLDEPVPDGDFAFVPPPGAALVSEIPPPYGITPLTPPADTANNLPKMVGRMEPAATYHAADGSTLRLDSLRGHPVLIDLWATWCAPCLGSLPDIQRIQHATKDAGLVVLGFDEDHDLRTAPDYLRRKGYDWPDYHIDVAKPYGLPNIGIPLVVLIDVQGRIVYYHDDGNDIAGLTAAIRSLGPDFDKALGEPTARP